MEILNLVACARIFQGEALGGVAGSGEGGGQGTGQEQGAQGKSLARSARYSVVVSQPKGLHHPKLFLVRLTPLFIS